MAAKQWHRHIVTPTPSWPAAVVMKFGSRRDYRYLTAAVPAKGGGYWFSYGEVDGVGRIGANGSSTLREVVGFGRIRSMTANGEDLYVTDYECRVGRIRGLALVEARNYRCVPTYAREPQVTLARGEVWITGGTSGIVERRFAGTRREWRIDMIPTAVAVVRDGTAYVLGYGKSGWHPMIAVIPPRRDAVVTRLPMLSIGTIAVDGRDRIWITDPFNHAAAVIAPPGEWG